MPASCRKARLTTKSTVTPAEPERLVATFGIPLVVETRREEMLSAKVLVSHQFVSLLFVVAEIAVGLDLNRGLDDNDEGKYWSGARGDSRGASRMSPLWSFHIQRLTHVEARL